MDFEKIHQLIKSSTHPSRFKRGLIYYNSQLVEHVGFSIDNDILTFEGMVESEFNNEVYTPSLSINTKRYSIVGGGCTCIDCTSRSGPTKLFICKHIVAICLKSVNDMRREVAQSLVVQISKPKYTETTFKNPVKEFLNYFDNSKKEVINLDVNLNINEDNTFTSDFKIGTDKVYVLKNLKEFMDSKSKGTYLEYGKNFTFNPKAHTFSYVDEQIIDFIEEYTLNHHFSSSSNHQSKFLRLNNSDIKRFLEILSDKDFKLNYLAKEYTPSVFMDTLPVSFSLEKDSDNVIFSCKDTLPLPLTSKGDVLFFEGNFYLLNTKDGLCYNKIYSFLKDSNSIKFEKDDIHSVLSNLLPQLQELSDDVLLDENITENTTSEFFTKYYLDLKSSSIICDIKYIYKDDNGNKFILRDIPKEKEFEKYITDFKFEKYKNYYIFRGNDETLFNFLETGINTLKEVGEVYYSDKFKNKRVYSSSNIKANISSGIEGYLEFSFNIGDINQNEYKNILLALKSSSKFYKLKDGSFLNLQEEKTKSFLELVDNLDLANLENHKIHKSKALYIDDIFNSNDFDFINGKEYISDISTKFKNVENTKLKVPSSLKDTLRDYQVEGFNWLNTLSHYEFGGILADEMGLGKTLQTISFLSAHKGKKSIIVTPTSLIYNWKNEFDTFAPCIKVGLIHGAKKEREKLISERENYDVIITTYGTLRNDFDLYENTCFDFCIIDEAQNIKNPQALSTEAVKDLKASVKFALTGTPIENNLLELWSIFDFIMPGYLYSKSKFQNLFMSANDNTYNLKKLIKPFILRRNKKDVMLELPDKIEKKFFVELNDEERKIYKSYIDDINNNIKTMDMKKDKMTILSYLTKLRQLCLDPNLIINDYNGSSSKIEACLEILNDSVENNHKVLLFSQFTSALQNIGNHLDKNNVSYYYLDGQTPAKERLKLVDDFNNSKDVNVFLISLRAGGTGLNLTSADVVIHFDPWWNPSVENQASDRAHRFGQKNIVNVIKMIAKGTIEEKIIKLQENKKELIDEFINGDLSDGGTLKSLSEQELIELFN